MKFVSWNVNGLRACLDKGFIDIFKNFDADIFALQETKMQQFQAEVPTDGYFQYWNSADKKGYSGPYVFEVGFPDSKATPEECRILIDEWEKMFSS